MMDRHSGEKAVLSPSSFLSSMMMMMMMVTEEWAISGFDDGYQVCTLTNRENKEVCKGELF